MFRLSVLLIALGGFAAAATAADLPAGSRLGVIFAEPPPPPPRAVIVTGHDEPVYAPEIDIRPKVNGYYGKPKSFRYRSYYGTPPEIIFGRLPYACGEYGYC